MNRDEQRKAMRKLIFGMIDMQYHNSAMRPKRIDTRSKADFILDTMEQAEEILTCQN